MPVSDAATSHLCGALGIAGVKVAVDDGRSKAVDEAVGAIVGEKGVLGAPRTVNGLRRPWVQVQAARGTEGSDNKVLKLALVLQTAGGGGGGGDKAPHDIRQPVGDGEVEILFE